MSTERLADGKSDPEVTGEVETPPGATLDLDSSPSGDPAPADDPWIRQLTTAAGTAAPGTGVLFGAVALLVAALAAAQPACVYPDDLFTRDGLPRWAVVAFGLAAVAAVLGAAGIRTARRIDASLPVAVSLAALLLAGATVAITVGDVATRPHFDRESLEAPGERDEFTGLPVDACR